MPLFVIKETIEKLDIDAIALPTYDGLSDFYKNNSFNSENLLDLYNSFLDKEKIKKLSNRLKNLKNRYKKIVDINRSRKIYRKYSKIINEIIFKKEYELSYYFEHRRESKKYSKIDILEIINRHPDLSENIKKQLIDSFKDSDTVPEKEEKYNISEILSFKKLSEEQLIKELELFEKYINKKERFEELEEITKNNIEKLENELLTINRIEDKHIITFNYEINDFIYSPFNNYEISNLSNIYERIIDVALSNNISQIAIPVIDFKDMPNRNYYIDTIRDALREYLDETEKDIIVYLLLTDINNDYCQDSEPENIYERISSLHNKIYAGKIDKNQIENNAKNELKKYKEYLNPDKSDNTDLFFRSNNYLDLKYNGKEYSDNDYLDFYLDYLSSYVYKKSRFSRNRGYGKDEDEKEQNDEDEKEQNDEDLKYWDEKAFWEEIDRRRKEGFCFSIGGDKFPKYRKNNKRILNKLGVDLKARIKQEDEQENYLIADKLHKEIESLINLKTESFSQMVLRIINETDRDRIKCYKSANVDKNIFSKIVKDASGDIKEDGTTFVYKPDKKIVLAFAIALRLNINEANELLRKAGYAFSNYPQDIIVKSFIEKGIYDIDIVNQFLLRFNQPLLGSTARE